MIMMMALIKRIDDDIHLLPGEASYWSHWHMTIGQKPIQKKEKSMEQTKAVAPT